MTIRDLIEVLNAYPEDYFISIRQAGEELELEEVEIRHFNEHVTLVCSGGQ